MLTLENKYIKRLYVSDFFLSTALGMIPLMTVLSYFITSLSTSTITYAIVLSLYNISSTLPKMYVAKKVCNKPSTFNSLIKFRLLQIYIWILISALLFTDMNKNVTVILFSILYIIYSSIKGSTDILYIDIYSKIISSKKLGKFFGYKHSLNNIAEFIGATSLVYLFKYLNIDINYAYVFSIVLILDIISVIFIISIKKMVVIRPDLEFSPSQVDRNSIILEKYYEDSCSKRNKIKHLIINYINEINDIINKEVALKNFLIANIISIIGASIASFFIPFGKSALNLTIEDITLINLIWLISKIVFSVIWGYLTDICGSKYIMIGSRVCILISYIIAFNLNSLLVFYIMIILHGASSTALVIMSQNIFIEINHKKGSIYSAVNSIVCMPFFVIMPLVASFLSETYGFRLCFIISSLPIVISLILMLKVNITKNKTLDNL